MVLARCLAIFLYFCDFFSAEVHFDSAIVKSSVCSKLLADSMLGKAETKATNTIKIKQI